MRIGLELLTAHPFGWMELRQAAISVEEAGFDSLWVPDHIEKDLGGETMAFYDVVAMLGGIAEITSRVSIGASVHNAALRHPFRLAHAALTLDEMSSGRFVLGIGAGSRGYEYGYVGGSTDHGFSRFTESVEIVASLLKGGEVTFEGRFWRTNEARVMGIEARDVPLMIGATGRRTIDLAFRWGDEWNTVEIAEPTPENLAERVALADKAAAQYQRSVRRSIDLMVSPVPAWGHPHIPALPAITGSPEQIAESLLAFADIGFDEVHCYGPAPYQAGSAAWLRIIDLLHAYT
ncbi:MAG TPA: LLM class flavin-dependent oxidoreductase [Acidimicrobiia bacterium]|nr:LLM class flavin-dependent oxidoreductase [Acidimicrobiia bacterium]